MTDASIKEAVREKYGQAAQRVGDGCCGTSVGTDAISSNLYSDEETGALPEAAVAASLSCGNPTALAELKPGETVLDLGSGGGIDVLLSARRVGPSGKAYGLDMTDEMLAFAGENQHKAGIENVEFLKGEIEAIPLPDNSVDVIISNCVINLSGDKDAVLREAQQKRPFMSALCQKRTLPPWLSSFGQAGCRAYISLCAISSRAHELEGFDYLFAI